MAKDTDGNIMVLKDSQRASVHHSNCLILYHVGKGAWHYGWGGCYEVKLHGDNTNGGPPLEIFIEMMGINLLPGTCILLGSLTPVSYRCGNLDGMPLPT